MNIEQEILSIKKRNQRVEQDKAWETSWIRRISITILTYVVIVSFFLVAELPKPFTNALVPSLAFLLSQLTLPFIKKMWETKKEIFN